MVQKEVTAHPIFSDLSNIAYQISPSLQSHALNFAEKVSSSFSGRFSSINHVPFPQVVDIELTAICNLRCRMCWWWGENGIAKKISSEGGTLIKNMLDTSEIFNIVDEVSANKSSLYLSGAEIFTRKDIPEILEYISSKGIPTSFTTNGTLIKDLHIDLLSKMRNLRINFSIDGLQEIHDSIRGKGNFTKTTEVIRKLARAKQGNRFPYIVTNTTFSPDIVGKLHELVAYLISLGADSISFQHLWFTDDGVAKLHKQRLLRDFGIVDNGVDSHVISNLPIEPLDYFASEVVEIQKRRYAVPVRVNPRLTKDQILRYYADLSFSKRKACPIPWNKILIKANGEIMFCPDEWVTEFSLGNIREKSIGEVWNGLGAQEFRKSLKENGLFPICARCCSINMN